MASLWITEYNRLAKDKAGNPIMATAGIPIANEQVTFTTATASTNFSANTHYIRVYGSAAFHLTFGNPTATAADVEDPKYAADTEYIIEVDPLGEVNVYDGSS